MNKKAARTKTVATQKKSYLPSLQEQFAALIPTTWLDSLLTGPEPWKVGMPCSQLLRRSRTAQRKCCALAIACFLTERNAKDAVTAINKPKGNNE
jgi:hypothetical protein